MVWGEKVLVISMVTNAIESKKKTQFSLSQFDKKILLSIQVVVKRNKTSFILQSQQYWPRKEGESMSFNNFEVKTIAVKTTVDYVYTSLELTNLKVKTHTKTD